MASTNKTRGYLIVVLLMVIVAVIVAVFVSMDGGSTDNTTTGSEDAMTSSNEATSTNINGDSSSGGDTTTEDGTSDFPSSQELLSGVDDYQEVLNSFSTGGTSTITFKEGDVITGSDVVVEDMTAYIVESGTYSVSGSSSEGRIIVDLEDEGYVNLVLNGLDLSSSEDSPITINEAKAVLITVSAGSTNTITDNSQFTDSDDDEDATNAAIFSSDDLYINGGGTLVVNSENTNGIQSKDQLVIISGTITVDAAKEAIKAKDYLLIEDCVLSLTSGEDGMVATEDGDTEKGFIIINGGAIDIDSAQDGIQAETYVIINGGEITISTSGESDSTKGIKAVDYVEINDGTISINSVDDSIHSGNEVRINGGSITASSSDDGIHADAELTINAGNIAIEKSYEGLESKNIVINGGDIRIKSSDDGINIADGTSTDARGGMMGVTSNALLKITGGYVYMNADGDGLDSNGDMYMSGGTVIVNGPLMNGNGGLDVAGECQIDGGLLIVAGSIGMAEAPDSTSSQNSVSIGFSSQLSAGTTVYIESESGEDVITFTSSKAFQSFVLSSEDLETGETYNIYTGGSGSGSSTDGLYDSVGSKGTLYESFTISSPTTTVGTSGTMGGGTPMGGGRTRW